MKSSSVMTLPMASPVAAKPAEFLDVKLIARDEFAKALGFEARTMADFFRKHNVPIRRVCGQATFLMSDFLRCVPVEEPKPGKKRGAVNPSAE